MKLTLLVDRTGTKHAERAICLAANAPVFVVETYAKPCVELITKDLVKVRFFSIEGIVKRVNRPQIYICAKKFGKVGGG